MTNSNWKPVAWIRGDKAMTQDTLSDHDIADQSDLLSHGWTPVYSAPVKPAAVAVPDGWVLVPKEPTQRMLEVMHLRYWRGTATGETVSAHWKDCSAPLWKETYREMLAAAQAKGEKP